MIQHTLPALAICFVSLLPAPWPVGASAGPTSRQPAEPSHAADVVGELGRVLEDNYYDTELARVIATALERRLGAGEFNDLDDSSLAQALTRALYDESSDLHFQVGFDPSRLADNVVSSGDAASEQQAEQEKRDSELDQLRKKNYGFRDLRILEGNVGYLAFDYFADPNLAYPTLESSMHFLANVDALIIDVRDNNGGYLETAQLLQSFFFSGEEPVRFLRYRNQEAGELVEREQWVLPAVPGKRIAETPLYVLTSSVSFSAAEWFAFVLKNLGRATVVGERTAGGAHPVNPFELPYGFSVNVPTGLIQDSVFETDFEGVGVDPDVEVASEQALLRAHELALADLSEKYPARRAELEWWQPLLSARKEAHRAGRRSIGGLSASTKRQIAGSYGSRAIFLEGDNLYYSWNGKTKILLTALTETLFRVQGSDDFRFRVRWQGDRVAALERVFANGDVVVYERTN